MRLLLDTHVLIWTADDPARLPRKARDEIEDGGNVLLFSVISLWEAAIKRALGRRDFMIDPRLLRTSMLEQGCIELGFTANHAFAAAMLPPIHRDPFDRALVAQAKAEGVRFLTADAVLAGYDAPVEVI